jgi:phytoene dehydrogenase-like protein
MPEFTGVPDNRYINRGGQGFTGSLETMERAYDSWKHKRWSADPFVEGVIPSAWDPTVAPPGKHWMSNFVQYCPPELDTGQWTPADRDQFGQAVIDKIARYSPGFKDLIVHVDVRTPYDMQQEIGLTEGNIFQAESLHVWIVDAPRRRCFFRVRRQRSKRNTDGSATHELRAR